MLATARGTTVAGRASETRHCGARHRMMPRRAPRRSALDLHRDDGDPQEEGAMARTPSRRRRPGTRRSTQRKGAPVRALRFARAPHEAVRPILNSATLLNEFLAKVVELTPEERALI